MTRREKIQPIITRQLYAALFYLAMPFALGQLLWRSRKMPAYRQRLGERFWPSQLTLSHCIWIHTVSVGEFLAAIPLIKQLLKHYPNIPLLITSMTPTSSEQIKKVFGDQVRHVYIPYDLPFLMRCFFTRVNPRLLLIMETELWPQMIHQAYLHQVPCLLINARLSARSAQKYAYMQAFTQAMLNQLSYVCVQAEQDAQRFFQLGLPKNRMSVTGSIKFDLSIDDTILFAGQSLRQQWGKKRFVWIAASTHVGEESLLLRIQQTRLEKNPDSLLVLVPRHPDRVHEIIPLIQSLHLSYVCRSTDEPVCVETQVLLVDTMGELLKLYAASDVAVVGGSFIPRGGHNVLEPIALQKPTIVGPHVFNFQTIVDELLEDQGLLQAENAEQLADMLDSLEKNPEQVKQLVQQGTAILNRNKGALDRVLTCIYRTLP